MVKILSASSPPCPPPLFFSCLHQIKNASHCSVWMLPECHLLVGAGTHSIGSHAVHRCCLIEGQPLTNPCNLFTICCLQVLPEVMLMSPDKLGLSRRGAKMQTRLSNLVKSWKICTPAPIFMGSKSWSCIFFFSGQNQLDSLL